MIPLLAPTISKLVSPMSFWLSSSPNPIDPWRTAGGSTLSGRKYLTTTPYQMNVHPALYMPRSHFLSTLFHYSSQRIISQPFDWTLSMKFIYIHFYLVSGIYYVLGITHLIVFFTLKRFCTLSPCVIVFLHTFHPGSPYLWCSSFFLVHFFVF